MNKNNNNTFQELNNLLKALESYNCLNKSNNLFIQLPFNASFIKTNKFLDVTISLPHSGKNDTTLAVIGSSEDEFFARENNINIVGISELESALNDKTIINHIICNSSYLNELNPFMLSLGANGLLPSKLKGTLTTDVKQSINFFKEKSTFIKQKTPQSLYLKLGEFSYDINMLNENIDYILNKLYIDTPKSAQKIPSLLGISAHNSPMFYLNLAK